MKQFKTFCLFSMLLLLIVVGCGSAESINLSLNWEPGSSFRYVQELDQEITQSMFGQQQVIKQNMVFTIRYDVHEEIDNNGIVVQTHYERIEQNMNVGGVALEYDSENPSAGDHPAAQVLGKMVGESFEIVLSEEGSVREIRGIDAMYERMFAELGQEGEQMLAMMKQTFGEEALKDSFEQMFQIYSPQERWPGDSWSENINLVNPFPMQINTEFTLKSASGGNAIISAVSEMNSGNESTEMQMGPSQVSYQAEGKQTGELVFNYYDNFLESAEFEQQLSGNMTVYHGDHEHEVPLRIDGKINVKGEKLN